LVKPTGLQLGVAVPFLGPGDSLRPAWNCAVGQPADVPVREAPIWELGEESAFWSVRIQLIDAAGRGWQRIDNGEPFEVRPDLLPDWIIATAVSDSPEVS
jgi:hypothetical protein